MKQEISDDESSDSDQMQINNRRIRTIPGTDIVLKSSRISGIEQLKIFGFDETLKGKGETSRKNTKRTDRSSRRVKELKPSQ